ncbi:MAG: hypothetical protein JWR68_1658 [Polaromonas sp.]|nr:hypothetical protein [Polaromonas sp.]
MRLSTPHEPSFMALAISVLGAAALCHVSAAQGQETGLTSLGATGGLNIPSAYVLNPGTMALSAGNYQDPKFGSFSRRQNYTLGIGLLPGVEVFGRFAEYQNPLPRVNNGFDINGPRDISANIKWQLPIAIQWLPKLAVGATDVGGGAVNFRSKYAVASDEYGPLHWSLGYAKGESALGRIGGGKVLDGLFGGAELRLGNTGAAVLAETDGTQRHAGLRYYSDRLSMLGDSQIVGTVQRSFGATTLAGRDADATSFNVSLVVPLGASEAVRKTRSQNLAKPLPPIASTATGGMVASSQDRMDRLAQMLQTSGLDRVRIGALGTDWVIEYENYRYLQNEADALGIVLGLAAENASAGVTRIHAVALKAGQAMLQTSVEVAAFRDFLRDADAPLTKDAFRAGSPGDYDPALVQWASGASGTAQRRTWARVSLAPAINYALGTEYGAFDYSLALNLRGTVPLWRGGEVYTDVTQRVSHSDDVAPGRAYAGLLHRNGLKTLALQQSFWLGPRLFTSVGAGKYNYVNYGAEGESMVFLPWNEDTVHFKGSYQRNHENRLARREEAYAASYRWKLDTQTWIEGAYNQYTDRSTGPALAMTRWFGDVAVQVFARKGGRSTFVGMELSLPLTPRQGMGAGPVQLSGTPRFAQSLRTMVENGVNQANYVQPNAVRPVELSYKPEMEMLNSGRITPDYLRSQVQRMRESFFLYARDQID